MDNHDFISKLNSSMSSHSVVCLKSCTVPVDWEHFVGSEYVFFRLLNRKDLRLFWDCSAFVGLEYLGILCNC